MEKPPRYPVVRPLVMLLAMLVSHASATVALSSTMGVSDKILDGLDEVDVIIAGGGTTGCVVAARLSDADPDLSILVVERGHDNYEDPTVTNPLFFLENILDLGEPNPRMMVYQGQAEPNIGNRTMVVPAGSILGGGSSINMLTYTRPQREDLDGWSMPEWSADSMLPYFNKFETYHGPSSSSSIHGSDGPIHISNASYGPTQLQGDFIRAAADLGIPEDADLQDLDSNHGMQKNLRYISPDGIRQDSAHAYLHPRLQDGKHPNLHVVVEHEVVRVLSEKGKAVGVEIRSNPDFGNGTQVQTVKAKKMVVVSAGTLGTPLLLERSGVGGKDVLDKAGVEVVSDVPGVGEDFQDHNTMLVSYYTSLLPNETYDDILNGQTTLPQMLEEKHAMLAWNSAEITSKVRPTDKEIDAMGLSEGARLLWDRDFKNNKNKPVATISTANGFIAPIAGEDKDWRFLSTGSFLLYPYARGHVHITGPAIEDKIDLTTGILTDPEGFDRAMAMWLYKKQREVVRRLDVFRGEYAALHPPFNADSDAACKRYDGPLPSGASDIKYTKEDDEVLSKWITNNLAQNWHGIGTCKMATCTESGGVVDGNLSVYGVKSLKVADLSVVAHNVAANTGSMAFAIGEKAADIFAKELETGKTLGLELDLSLSAN